MAISVLTGNDTIIIQNRPITDLADGNPGELTFPDNLANVKIGKNGNAIYALNTQGLRSDFKLRLVRGTPDDIFLNGLLNQQNNNFAGFVLLIGQFVKKLGDGKGNLTSDTYITNGGMFMKQIAAKTNVEGHTDQSVAEYNIFFANTVRVIT